MVEKKWQILGDVSKAISDNSPKGGGGLTSPSPTKRVRKLIKKRNNSVGWAIAKKIGEIEKMIIFKKSTLTGAFFLTCLISENWFLIFINQIGTQQGSILWPRRTQTSWSIFTASGPKERKPARPCFSNHSPLGGWGVWYSGPCQGFSGRTAPMTEGNRYSRSIHLYKG